MDDSVISDASGSVSAPRHSERLEARGRLVPPDRKPPTWWSRHRYQVYMLEWPLTFIFFALTGYFLWLLVFPPPSPPPSRPVVLNRESFRRQLRALAPIQPAPEWSVQAREGRWRSIVIHHSATRGGSAASIDKYHRNEKKMENGLGYHFLIGNGNGMPDGEVAVGNRWTQQLDGAHVRKEGANSYSIGICLVGNFNESLPTQKQLAALKGLLSYLRKEYGIGLASIVGHNSVVATDCPGHYFFVDEIALVLANP